MDEAQVLLGVNGAEPQRAVGVGLGVAVALAGPVGVAGAATVLLRHHVGVVDTQHLQVPICH